MQPETVNISDETLVQRCQAGDAEALERLIIKYKDRLYNVIFRMCRNADDAAELTQETFVKVIESINKFKGRSSFYTWLFRIAVNASIASRARRSGDNIRNAARCLPCGRTAPSAHQALAYGCLDVLRARGQIVLPKLRRRVSVPGLAKRA